MHVLAIAGWYPDEGTEYDGVFIREHLETVAKKCHVTVVHLEVEKSWKAFPWKIETRVAHENGLTVLRLRIKMAVRRFGLHDHVVKMAYENLIEGIKRQKPFDLCHVNVRMHLSKLVTELDALKDVPLAYTEHFTYYHTGINQLPGSKRKKAITEAKAWFRNPNIKSVMPVSQELADVLVNNFGIEQEKIAIIGNVANSAFTYNAVPPTTESVKIVLGANWSGNKDPLLFVKALKMLSQEVLAKLQIDWIGGGSKMLETEAYVKQNLSDLNITFHGFQSKKFIARKLHEGHFLVHPTTAENLPCIIIESLCCGVPVLSNRVNGVPELLDENNGLMAEAGDLDGFKSMLEDMIANVGRYNRKEIAKAAGQRFSAVAIGRQIFSEYQKVVKK